MGLNPFWLSWCYSLQISNEDREGRVRGGAKKEGKVHREGSRGKSQRLQQTPKLPIIPYEQEAIDGQ